MEDIKELTKQAQQETKVLRMELDETKRKHEAEMEKMRMELEETKNMLNNCKYCNCITIIDTVDQILKKESWKVK